MTKITEKTTKGNNVLRLSNEIPSVLIRTAMAGQDAKQNSWCQLSLWHKKTPVLSIIVFVPPRNYLRWLCSKKTFIGIPRSLGTEMAERMTFHARLTGHCNIFRMDALFLYRMPEEICNYSCIVEIIILIAHYSFQSKSISIIYHSKVYNVIYNILEMLYW